MENYENWKKEYYTKAKVNLQEEFSKKELEYINKLGIEIEKKTYTESEFEELYEMLLTFYDSETERPKEILQDKSITVQEYRSLVEKFKKVNEKYNF